MIVLWILGILVLLVICLCLTRVGVRIYLADGSIKVDIRLGPLHFRVFPGKEKKEEKQSGQQPAKSKKTEEKKTKPKITFKDVKDAVKTLWPPLKKALGRTRRGIRIDPMDLNLTLGGADDPAAAAELYGYLNAGVWTGMPALEKVLDIPEPGIHLGIDFDAAKPVLEGKIGISARIGTLLAVAIGIAFPALRWFLSFQKRMKQDAAPQPAV